MPDSNRVQWVYSSKDNAELGQRYDEWAEDYESDLERDFDWSGHIVTAEAFARHVPESARILDAGVGTGLSGVVLSDMGYSDLTGIDLSEGMLQVARAKALYRDLRQMVLGERLDFPTDTFDAVISAGVFSVGHAPASAFDEIGRVTKPGGHFVFTLRPDVYEQAGFKDKQEQLEARGAWKVVERSEPLQLLPKGEPDVWHQVWVYQILA